VSGDRSELEAQLASVVDLLANGSELKIGELDVRLLNARVLFNEAVAELYCAPFNAYLQSSPQRTVDEKRQLSREANDKLRTLGLAIRCPRTGRAAWLLADAGGGPGGRFQLSLASQVPKRRKTVSFAALPSLTLVPRPERQEPFLRPWTERVGEPNDQDKFR
jgi:hypothetical protein